MNLNPISLGYYKELIRPSAIDEVLALPASLSLAININFDCIGAMQTRPGITSLGLTTASPVYGMANFVSSSGTYQLLANADTSVYMYNGSWSAVRTSLTAGSKARFTSLVNCLFMVNGNGNEVCSTYTGSGSFGSTNVASLPKGDFIENYRSRIWVGDASSGKIYYSDVVTTSNTITGGTSFIQVSPQDGDILTGLKRSLGSLLVFKQNHIYRIYSINSADPDPYINVGTYSQESIIEAKDGIYFHSPKAFYQLQEGSAYPVEISKKISDILTAIPRSAYSTITGWGDGDYLYWSVGTITLDRVSYQNVVCRYTISTQLWTLASYPIKFTSACRFDDGTTLNNVVGGTNGLVYQHNVGTDDNGTPIFYEGQTQWLYITKSKNTLKDFSEVAFIHENAQGANLSYKLDTESPNNWQPIGSVDGGDVLVSTFPLNANNFKRIKLRVSGTSSGVPIIMRGFELLSTQAYE